MSRLTATLYSKWANHHLMRYSLRSHTVVAHVCLITAQGRCWCWDLDSTMLSQVLDC